MSANKKQREIKSKRKFKQKAALKIHLIVHVIKTEVNGLHLYISMRK